MIVRALSLFAALVATSAAGAPDQRTTRDAGRRLESLVEGKRFEAIATVAALPPAVKAAWAGLMKQDTLSIADPERPFQATDDIGPDRTLPGRRLIFAGQSGDLVVVHYETGGYAHSYSLVLFRVTGGRAEAIAATRTKGAIPGLGDLDDLGRHAMQVNSEPFQY